MADVFISYKRDERPAIEVIANRLRRFGLGVWFDASMNAGEAFNHEIDREARSAQSVLVCWSPEATSSRWVIAEAMIGFDDDKLVAAQVSGADRLSPPTPFNTTHVADLRAWLIAPDESDAEWRSVLRRVGKLCERHDIDSWSTLSSHSTMSELSAWLTAHEGSPLRPFVARMLERREALEAAVRAAGPLGLEEKRHYEGEPERIQYGPTTKLAEPRERTQYGRLVGVPVGLAAVALAYFGVSGLLRNERSAAPYRIPSSAESSRSEQSISINPSTDIYVLADRFKRVRSGMTSEQVVDTLGEPPLREQQLQTGRSIEQWWYGNHYVSLVNGYVTNFGIRDIDTVTEQAVDARTGPSTDYPVTFSIGIGEEVRVDSVHDGWCLINSAESAWIPCNSVRPPEGGWEEGVTVKASNWPNRGD